MLNTFFTWIFFQRLTAVRKATGNADNSSSSGGGGGSANGGGGATASAASSRTDSAPSTTEKGTIHTKRHGAEEQQR